MKRNFMFAAVLTLFVMAVSVSAQKSSFSGTWELDLAKSKLGERVSIESQTLTVVQSDKDVKVSMTTKRGAPPAGAPAGGGGPRPGGGGGGATSGASTFNYTLDGKEVTVQQETPSGAMPVRLTGKSEGGKLMLANSRTFSTPNGEMTATTKETWSVSADGTTLTVDRETTSQLGTSSTQSVYTRKN